MSSTLAKIREQRLSKAAKLREMGIDPYPARSEKSNVNAELVKDFKKFEGKEVTIAGRIMSWREHGALRFANVQDMSGLIQVIIRKDNIEEFDREAQRLGWKELELLDIGDFIQAKGKLIKSKTDEISVDTEELKILTKAIRPLPDKWEGIKDKETKFRRRYLDFALNKPTRELFVKKNKFWRASMEYLEKNGFLFVQTPVLEETTGGADATPFVTHYHALDSQFYLRISPELHLKRMIGGGFEKIYDLGPVFRNEGMSDEHAQDYWHLEYYWAYADFNDGMDFVRDLIRYSAEKAFGTLKFETRGHKFDLEKDWEEVNYPEIIKQRFNIDIFKASEEEMFEILQKEGVDIEFDKNRNRLIDNLWKVIRKKVSGPAFLINVPKFLSPLAKSRPEDQNITERFQVLIGGSENGNGYSEINDPIDQYRRFLDQQQMRDSGDDEAQMMDIDYVEMLEYGMPPCTGYGQSERLFWFLANVTAREGVTFPLTRPLLEQTTKEIYGIERPRKISTQGANKFDQKLKQLRNQFTANSLEEIDNAQLMTINEQLMNKFDNINVGVAIIKDVKVEGKAEDLTRLMSRIVIGIEATLAAEDIDDIPQIASYQEMYKQMGVDLHSRKSSPEAMLRRVVEGEELYSVNTCVDAYNAAVLMTQISAGAFDLDKMKFPAELREAKEGESIKIIGGEEKKLKKGEVCYFDETGAYNMDYNFRDADRTRVTENTKNLWINVEGVNQISRDQVADALRLTVDLITKFCGGKVELIGLLANQPVSQKAKEQKSKSDDQPVFDERKPIDPGITRPKALELIKANCKKENMLKHMLASEAGCREYAEKYAKEGKLHKDNMEVWGIAGLLHDITFEDDPDNHWNSGADKLEKMGVSKYITDAIRAHGNDDYTEHKTLLDSVLLLSEHSTGLVVTTALVLPSKKLADVKVSSIIKKMKDKRFAASISRDVIRTGCEKLGLTLQEQFEILLRGMMKIEKE
ncbi:MAG: lysine--tRNA ligase, partial [Candidatus Dojkabacteria bacterium]|nr:lysine--tRNA ligase [Candidatus Dojkabacteria bacterium]